jgi:hypothetical protein
VRLYTPLTLSGLCDITYSLFFTDPRESQNFFFYYLYSFIWCSSSPIIIFLTSNKESTKADLRTLSWYYLRKTSKCTAGYQTRDTGSICYEYGRKPRNCHTLVSKQHWIQILGSQSQRADYKNPYKYAQNETLGRQWSGDKILHQTNTHTSGITKTILGLSHYSKPDLQLRISGFILLWMPYVLLLIFGETHLTTTYFCV